MCILYLHISSCTRLIHNQPTHKNERTQPTADTHNLLRSACHTLRGFLLSQIMIEIYYSDIIDEISIIIWLGKKTWSELGGIWESEFGFWRGSWS